MGGAPSDLAAFTCGNSLWFKPTHCGGVDSLATHGLGPSIEDNHTMSCLTRIERALKRTIQGWNPLDAPLVLPLQE